MTHIRLRDYQRQAIDDIFSRRRSGARRVPIVLATGLGKTQIFTSFVDEWLTQNPGQRALIIAHTNELIEQAAARMRLVAPDRRVGIVKGAQNNAMAEIVVSSRQTLASEKRRLQLRRVGLIVIDECHHAVATNTYGKIIEHFAGQNPDLFALGVTATLVRGDKAKLSSVWEEVTFKRDILFGIRNGYLLDVRGERVIVPELDLTHVKVKGGDYSEGALGEELERTFAPEIVAREYARVAGERKGVAFWPLVATAESGARAFNDLGIASAVVHGAMPLSERTLALKRLRTGEIQVIHNAMVLTEGWDEPSVEVAVIARPTKSAGLYQQMVGRVLRKPEDFELLEPFRQVALIMDVTGASATNDLRSLIDLSPERPLSQAREEHEDATLSELDEFALAIEEELAEQRAGASYMFESEDYAGESATREFDPLGRTKSWLQTSGGTYFVKATKHVKGDALIFLAPSVSGESGTYDIVRASVQSVGALAWCDGPAPGYEGLSLAEAQLHGEDFAGEAYNGKSAYKSARAASESQGRYARALGIEIPLFGSRAGALSREIDLTLATRRIDPLIESVRAFLEERDRESANKSAC